MTSTDKPGDPADKAADGAFGGVHSHRVGYGDDKLARVIGWLRDHPTATLASGEGALLLAQIDRLHVRNRQIADEAHDYAVQIEMLRAGNKDLADHYADARAEIDRLHAAIARVRALHAGWTRVSGDGYCVRCLATLRALDGEP